ncbi:AAA family ATPase [Lactiplantibacillus plantarum]|uniref:ATP-dependent nuclease n=1 Tax=Lactiplantibacillus plantarum TaxID=1590 RepID=UPI00271D1914|nr:ATP-binding protein [Lactiplantibacillus plantarum]MDO8196256.1 AAA family ATPase [Lactiplantibacillus plantarum]
MYIKKIVLHNFKSFSSDNSKTEDIEIQFTSGINYLVGNNNVGKTTILNSLDFLTTGGKKENVISKGHEQENVSVTIVIDDVNPLEGSLKKYNPYIENHQLMLKRSSEENTVKQGKDGKEKSVKFDIKKVRIFNFQKKQFENPTGIGNTITDLIDPQIVYADMHNEDYQDFGTTKTTGKLIQTITQDFQASPEFAALKRAHKDAFGVNGIKKYLSDTENNIDEILSNQFGNSKIKFKFGFPNVNDLIKKGNIVSTENGIETDISEKGNGLQRALALAIIQVYSKVSTKDENTQFLIDEPEIYLHPKAQDKLIDSLVNLSENGNQVFITTHSPYILRHYREDNDSIIILSLKKESNQKEINSVNSLLFSPTSIGEVTYRAFGVPNVDLHQLLFTKIYIYWIRNENPDNSCLSAFDDTFLKPECIKQSLSTESFFPRVRGTWKAEQQRTIPYIVRNEIDHPETLADKNKNVWSEDNLKQSIDCLMKIYKELSINRIAD